MATLIVTAFPREQKMRPILLFKGGGHVSEAEKKKWNKGVIVRFNDTATVDGDFMLRCVCGYLLPSTHCSLHYLRHYVPLMTNAMQGTGLLVYDNPNNA